MDGEPVVFVHGWPDSGFSFSRVVPLLPDTFRAVVFDQRGFGDSDKPESGYAIHEMAGDLLGLLDAIDIAAATIVGHSFGSFVARRAAIIGPERVGGLVLIGTGFTPANDVTRDVQKAMRGLPDPISQEFAREFQASTVYHPVPPEFFDRIVAESMKLPTRLWRLTFDSLMAYDDSRQLAGIKPRTLLLWGDHDALFSRRDQERFQENLPSAQLKIYEETGHCPNWERPEQVAADIAAFVRQVTPASR
jgi:pimeloyl-ACP methyl ester carboxylesterase